MRGFISALETSASTRPRRPSLQLLGTSRCFPFWQELLACYVVNTTDEDSSGGKKCLPALEDYYECLHHRKEVRPVVASLNSSSRSTKVPSNIFGEGRTLFEWPVLVEFRGKEANETRLASRRHACARCRLRTGRRLPRIRGRICRSQERFGIWGCWIRRRIRGLSSRRRPRGGSEVRDDEM